MHKFLSLLLSLSTSALAARDSVAYFYSPQKVNVLLNERGINSRIQQFMNVLGGENELMIVTGDMKLGCARKEDRATCTFTFYPSPTIKFINKELFVEKSLVSLELDERLEFEMSFQGSMKDQLNLRLSEGQLFIFASK